MAEPPSASQKTSVNQTGYNFTLGGFTAGADYRLRDNLLVGLATGYSNTTSGFYGSGGSVTANTIPFNAYAAYFPGSLYAYGSVGYALNLYDLKRGSISAAWPAPPRVPPPATSSTSTERQGMTSN